MTLIAKGVTIPTNTGKIIANNVDLTKVIAVHGGTSTTIWEKLVEQTILENGLQISGSVKTDYIFENYDSGTNEGSFTSGKIYLFVGTRNHDRVSYRGAAITTALDLTNFSKLNVSFDILNFGHPSTQSASIGIIKSLTNLWDSSQKAILTTSTGGARTLTLDLTAYKQSYGNTGYFSCSVQKSGMGEGEACWTNDDDDCNFPCYNHMAIIRIKKIWLS